jgi:preprotein translocase subunit SecG
MMTLLIGYVVPVIHVLSCFFLIVVVLLQTGKGADMGAVFGGGSQTLFGSSGAGNFLTKLTAGTAAAFMLTSLVLTYGARRSPTSRLIERLPAPVTETAPAPAAEDEPAADAAPAAEGEPVAGEETATVEGAAPVEVQAGATQDAGSSPPAAAEKAPVAAEAPPAKDGAAPAPAAAPSE